MKAKVLQFAPHERRVVIEAFELAERLVKLDAFFKGDVFCNLPLEEQTDLMNQGDAMADYLRTLDIRITRFESKYTTPVQAKAAAPTE